MTTNVTLDILQQHHSNTSTFCQVNNYCFLVPVAVMQLVVSINLELQALKKRWVSKVQYVCELQ